MQIRKKISFFYIFLLSIFFLACYSLDPKRKESPYYKDGRYYNLDKDEELAKKNFFTVLYWKLFSSADPLDIEKKPEELSQVPKVLPRKTEDFLAPKNTIRIVWIGHSSVWISIHYKKNSLHILTDPIFEGIALAHERLIPLPLKKEKLPPIDVVLVSHAHRDHFDIDSLRFIEKENPEVKIFLPDGSLSFAKQYELHNVYCLEWWEKASLENKDVSIKFQPAQHWSRMGIYDKMQSHWGSYTIQIGKRKIYFGGDTAYASHFRKIYEKDPIPYDIALLPIGAYKPRWFMKEAHLSPPEAIKASKDLQAKLLLPIHWGTFSLGDDLAQEGIEYLKVLLKKDKSIKAKYWEPGKIIDIPI